MHERMGGLALLGLEYQCLGVQENGESAWFSKPPLHNCQATSSATIRVLFTMSFSSTALIIAALLKSMSTLSPSQFHEF